MSGEEGTVDLADSGLTPAALQRRLRSPVFGHRVFYYATIGSTNDRALELAAAGEPEGAIVLAEQQTRGRGRRDRSWESPARLGIYVSIVLRPGVPAPRSPLFTLMAAVAVADALRETCDIQARIKWPNDVVVGRRKIAGILAESRGGDPEIRELVVGIGINVNHAARDFSDACRVSATSARIESGAPCDRAALLAAVLEGLERRYSQFLQSGAADLLREWQSLAAVPPGGRVIVEGAGGRVTGVVRGVDADGALLLEAPDGTSARVAFGEIVQTFW